MLARLALLGLNCLACAHWHWCSVGGNLVAAQWHWGIVGASAAARKWGFDRLVLGWAR